MFDGVLTLVTKHSILCIRKDKIAGQVQDITVSETSIDPLFSLYAQVFPEYAALERQYTEKQ